MTLCHRKGQRMSILWCPQLAYLNRVDDAGIVTTFIASHTEAILIINASFAGTQIVPRQIIGLDGLLVRNLRKEHESEIREEVTKVNKEKD